MVRRALSGRYAVERRIGHGGMATVFLARGLSTPEPVAIKVLHPEFAASLVGHRFHREIAILSDLHHPNILALLESGEAPPLVYYVTPFAEGASLRERLEAERVLSLEEAQEIARQVAGALDHAHARNVIHRDIKPENILFAGGVPTVCDFGVARAIVRAGGERLSSSGIVVGTPHYMSPEQAAGESHVDARSDIYALGCVVYEMLAGEPPFTGRTAQAIMARHVRQPPPSLRTVRPELPTHVERAILRALAKTPAGRQATATDFVREVLP